MKQEKIGRINPLVRVLGFGCTLLAASAAFAQQEAQKVEKIEVTGSSIKRLEGESALPVTVISRQEIEKSGATNPMELLQLVSANSSSGQVSFAAVIGATTFSAQTASLRGLGGGRTLVLINGKRVNGFSGEINGVQGVNLSVIPFAAIERVEILKDGASAVYGSDAIGGVINFILRPDYKGAEVNAYHGAPTRSGGGDQDRISASFGMGDLGKDRYNVFVAAQSDHQKSLDQRSRNFSQTSYLPGIGYNLTSGNTFPGTIAGAGAPIFPNCAPQLINTGSACRYDPNAHAGVEMVPDDKLENLFISGKLQINSNWQAYATALFSKDETHFTIQPVPVSDAFVYGPNGEFSAAITLPVTSPFYPHAFAAAHGLDGQPLNVRYRAVDNGNRDTTDTNKGSQFNGGVKGVLGNWDLDGSYTYAEGTNRQHLNGGFPLYSRLIPLLNTGNVNLFGPNTPEVVAQIQGTNFVGDIFNGKSKSYGFQGKGSTEIWNLPAGPLAMAIGGESRRETLVQDAAPVLATGDLSGLGGAIKSVSGSRDITALYAEFNIPILKGLEGDIALRRDHYSDFGTSSNPKASLRWEASKQVLLRASYGKGFLAPSLFQLFSPQVHGVSAPGTSDPIRCPVTGDPAHDCLTQLGLVTGGNPGLQPEKSEQATFGILFEPVPGYSVGADYFKIRLNNVITTGLPVSTILGNLGAYGNLVTRGPVDPAFPNLPGRITSIDQTNINIGAQHIEGIDLEAHARGNRESWGRLRFDVTGTYYRRNDSQNLDGSYTGFISDQFGAVVTGIVPRWKHYASLTWDRGPWTATLGSLFQSSYRDNNPDQNGDFREVSSMTLWDLQGTYQATKNFLVTLGVKNLFDTNPPLTNQNNSFQSGFDPSYYDPRARFVYGSVRYEFK